jgi:hypothetical protein
VFLQSEFDGHDPKFGLVAPEMRRLRPGDQMAQPGLGLRRPRPPGFLAVLELRDG